MNTIQQETFKKGCRVLYYGRTRKADKMAEKLTAEEEVIFNQVIEAHVEGIRDDRKREILRRRLGLSGFQKETCKAVGHSMGITGSRVGQLEQRALPELFRKIHPKWRSWIWE